MEGKETEALQMQLDVLDLFLTTKQDATENEFWCKNVVGRWMRLMVSLKTVKSIWRLQRQSWWRKWQRKSRIYQGFEEFQAINGCRCSSWCNRYLPPLRESRFQRKRVRGVTLWCDFVRFKSFLCCTAFIFVKHDVGAASSFSPQGRRRRMFLNLFRTICAPCGKFKCLGITPHPTVPRPSRKGRGNWAFIGLYRFLW